MPKSNDCLYENFYHRINVYELSFIHMIIENKVTLALAGLRRSLVVFDLLIASLALAEASDKHLFAI